MYEFANQDLVSRLKNEVGVLGSKGLERAFLNVDRADFVPGEYKPEAYYDYPLPIGEGQTISQPTTVAFMLEKLDPKPGDTVLDIGAGSGWTTALLASIVGEKGYVLGTEINPALVDMGRDNLRKYGFKHAEIRRAEGGLYVPSGYEPNKILVSASAQGDIPPELTDKLPGGGTLVIPAGNSIYKITKDESGELSQEEFPGFAFVPLM